MLETYEATRFVKVLESGRTRPVLLECKLAEDNGVSVGSFVVKAIGLPEVEEYGLFAETLGYLVAAELDIETPKPSLVRLSDEFVAAVNPVLQSHGLSLQPGIGFGSEHLGSGLISASADKYLDAEQTSAALNIFCYDLLIQNVDRIERNPNCLVKNGRIIAFDFNVAFSFLLLIGNVDEPWEVSKHRSENPHLFYRALKGKMVDFKPLLIKLPHCRPNGSMRYSTLFLLAVNDGMIESASILDRYPRTLLNLKLNLHGACYEEDPLYILPNKIHA